MHHAPPRGYPGAGRRGSAGPRDRSPEVQAAGAIGGPEAARRRPGGVESGGLGGIGPVQPFSTGPLASRQAATPPMRWQTFPTPHSRDMSTAIAERSPKAQ